MHLVKCGVGNTYTKNYQHATYGWYVRMLYPRTFRVHTHTQYAEMI